MASLLKASAEIQASKSRSKAETQAQIPDGEATGDRAKARKDKVLMVCSRGVTQRMRHLMRDLEVLLPHTKKGELHSKAIPHAQYQTLDG